MASKPETIGAYIDAAPSEGHTTLRNLYKLLRAEAPDAQEAIKWGTPFFIEPRFVFAFSAHKHHASFAPSAGAMAAFAEELKALKTTKGTVQLPYGDALPEALLRRMARHCLAEVKARQSDSFW